MPMISPPTMAPGIEVKPPRISTGSAFSAMICSAKDTSERAPHMMPVTSATMPAANQTMTQIWFREMPTESAALGALSVLILAAAYRRLTWEALVKSLRGSLAVTVMMLMIIVGSTTFSQILAFSGASSGVIGWATGFELNPYVVLLVMLLLLIVMGMFMDQLSMMMLTLPVFMPLIVIMGFDPIWFGVVMLLALELSLATPPFGLLLFIMVGVGPKGTTLGQVARAAAPYIACSLILILLLTAFPQIALWLPDAMR